MARLAQFSLHLNPRVRQLDTLFDLTKRVATDAMTAVDKVFRAHEKSLFATEGASGGAKWQELSEDYKKWKDRHFPGRNILTLEGEMRDAFSKKGGDHIAEVFKVGKWTIRVGAQGEKGFWHGTGAGNLPVRPPIQFRGDQAERIALEINRALVPHVKRVVKAFGRIRT